MKISSQQHAVITTIHVSSFDIRIFLNLNINFETLLNHPSNFHKKAPPNEEKTRGNRTFNILKFDIKFCDEIFFNAIINTPSKVHSYGTFSK